VHRGRKNRFDNMGPSMLVPQVVTLPTNRKPPSHLGEIEVGIWKRVLADYQFGTAIAFDVLTTSLEAHMRAREAREAIQRDGMTVIGRDGQQRPHPLLSVERDARAAWLQGLKMLELEL
jgi:phage terminase small subunit